MTASPLERIGRAAVHTVLGSRRWVRKQVAEAVADLPPGRALEIGSGPRQGDELPYSMLDLLPPTWTTETSDVVAAYGHRVLDVRNLPSDERHDLIICSSVLEHVDDLTDVGASLHGALAPAGVLVLGVPAVYPLHDEPADFWRFTEWSLRSLLEPFAEVDIRGRGPRRLPVYLVAVARRPT